MKLYIPDTKPLLIRVNIKKYKYKTVHLTLLPENSEDVYFCMNMIKEMLLKQTLYKLNPFPEGKHTLVEFREYKNADNGKTISFKVYNILPEEITHVIRLTLDEEI